MSELLKNSLKPRLLQLKCHFTWMLLRKNCETTEIEDILFSQLDVLIAEKKYMVHNLLSYLAHLKGNYQDAIVHLEKAEEIQKINSDEINRKSLVTYSNLAWIYFCTDQFETAKIYIEKVESFYQQLKSHDNIGPSEIYGEQGWSLMIFGRKCYEKAKECFEKALEKDPEDPEWNSGYATVVYYLEGAKCPADRCKSLSLLRRAIQINPQDSVVMALLALKLQEMQEVKEAKMYIEKALAQSPALPYLLRYVARFYKKEGLIEEALCVLQKALNIIPSSGFLHHQIALCYKQKKNQKKLAMEHRQHLDPNGEEIKGCTKNAIFHFETVLEYRRTCIFAYIDLAEIYSEDKQYEKAEETFQKAFNVKTLTEREKEQIYLHYGQFQECCRKLKLPQALIRYSGCPRSMAREYSGLGILKTDCDIDSVEERISNQIKFPSTPHQHKQYNLLAYIEHLKGDNDKAIVQVQKAVTDAQKNESDDKDIQLFFIYGNYAWLFYHTNQFQEAETYIKKVESIYKKFEASPNFNRLKLQIHGEQGRSLTTFSGKYYEKAKDCFLKGLEINPDDPELNADYATVVYRVECFRTRAFPAEEHKSLDLLKKAVRLNPEDSVIKVLLALKHQYLHQSEEGKRLVLEALEQTPNNPFILRHIGKFYRKERMIPQALSILKRGLQLTPNSSSLYHQMGLCHRQEVLRLKRSRRDPRSYRQRNEINEYIGNAIYCFQKAVEFENTFVSAYCDLAHMFAEQNDYKKAEEIFEKVLKFENLKSEDLQEIHFSYGKYEGYHKRSEKEAIKHFKEAIMIPDSTNIREYAKNDLRRLADKITRGDPSNPTGYALLAFIHQQSGETKQAVDCYKEALKYEPDNDEYLKALTDLQMVEGVENL
ncbi:interferon-induced protein with tetratricopeptide repeats 5-like [Discoglossus pictus]